MLEQSASSGEVTYERLLKSDSVPHDETTNYDQYIIR